MAVGRGPVDTLTGRRVEIGVASTITALVTTVLVCQGTLESDSVGLETSEGVLGDEGEGDADKREGVPARVSWGLPAELARVAVSRVDSAKRSELGRAATRPGSRGRGNAGGGEGGERVASKEPSDADERRLVWKGDKRVGAWVDGGGSRGVES